MGGKKMKTFFFSSIFFPTIFLSPQSPSAHSPH